MRYNPNEPRDDLGRWTKGPGADGAVATSPQPAAKPETQVEKFIEGNSDFSKCSPEKFGKFVNNVRNIICNELDKRSSWVDKLMLACKTPDALQQGLLPCSIEDACPGDAVILSPSDGEAGAASRLMETAAMAVNVLKDGVLKEQQGSHVITALPPDKDGKPRFLDHTLDTSAILTSTADFEKAAGGRYGGSKIITLAEFNQHYGDRRATIARPLALVDGKRLMDAAEEAQKDPNCTFITVRETGCSATVCSDKAAALIETGIGIPLKQKKYGLGARMFPNAVNLLPDITPGDFTDPNGIGRVFVTTPLGKEAHK